MKTIIVKLEMVMDVSDNESYLKQVKDIVEDINLQMGDRYINAPQFVESEITTDDIEVIPPNEEDDDE